MWPLAGAWFLFSAITFTSASNVASLVQSQAAMLSHPLMTSAFYSWGPNKQTNIHEDFPGVGLRHNLSSSCSVPSVWAFPSLSEQFVCLLLIVEHIKVDMTGHVKTSCCLYTLSPSAGLDEAPQTPLMNLCIHLKNNNHGPSLTRFLSLYMITPLGLPVCYCLGSLGNWWTLPVPQPLTVDMYGGP